MQLSLDVKTWLTIATEQVAAFFGADKDNPCFSVKNELHESLKVLLIHNATLWGHEDEVRRTDIPDADIARYKRLIDKENQLRNNAIDTTDSILAGELKNTGLVNDVSLPLNTETPGSACDRLVILLLRRFHLGLEIERDDASEEHREKCLQKRKEVEERIEDLSASLALLLQDILQGRKRLKNYCTHKLYNDPETNPAVRKAGTNYNS